MQHLKQTRQNYSVLAHFSCIQELMARKTPYKGPFGFPISSTGGSIGIILLRTCRASVQMCHTQLVRWLLEGLPRTRSWMIPIPPLPGQPKTPRVVRKMFSQRTTHESSGTPFREPLGQLPFRERIRCASDGWWFLSYSLDACSWIDKPIHTPNDLYKHNSTNYLHLLSQSLKPSPQ